MSFEQLKPYIEKSEALKHAIALLSFDRAAVGIKTAGVNTALTQSFLSKELLALQQDPELRLITNGCVQDASLTFIQKRTAQEMLDEIIESEKVPFDLRLKTRQACWEAAEIWPTCKNNNDWETFIPYVQEVFELNKEIARSKAKEGQSLYDVLLDKYLPGFNTKILDDFFDLLKKEIVPLLKKIQAKPEIQNNFLHQPFDPTTQIAYCRSLVGKLGFDFERGEIFESEHPFTTHFNNHDVRFTNHYHDDNLHSIFSAIHETGHALYEMGISDEITRTAMGQGTSTPMHEGQSRFYENMMGRNPLFWDNEYCSLQSFFPQLNKVTLDDFICAINKVETGLIRIQADELTYSLHIIIRYEIEKELINSSQIDYKKLPAMWNQKVKDSLGLDVLSDTEGILQDMHWGSGLIGYFPGYSLGSAIACQLYETFKKENLIEDLIKQQEYIKIRYLLQEKIHQFGKLYTTQDLLMQVCKEQFNPQYYVQYLKEKYTKLYQID